MTEETFALIVEDDDEWIEIFRETLKPYFIVAIAKSIPEVREKLISLKGRIEISLVDINLNQLSNKAKESGLDAMYILNREGIPCIAATVHDDGKTIRDALVIGGAKDVWFKHQDRLIELWEKINLVINAKTSNMADQKGMIINPSFRIFNDDNDPALVFVLMPFTESWSNDVVMLIRFAGEKNKLNIVRADDFSGPSNIIEDIWRTINKAELIVADITVHNANVFYELGIAHTLGKKVMLIRNKNGEKSPFDILQWRYIEYELTPIRAEEFKKELSKVFKEFIVK